MGRHVCPRCQKVFAKPTLLKRHQKRKTPCAPILEHTDVPEEVQADPEYEKKRCHFCGRVFSSYNVKRYHIRNACKIAPNKRNGNAGMEILYAHVARQDARHAAEIAQLRGEINALQGRPLAVAGRDGIVAGRAGIVAGRDVYQQNIQNNFAQNNFTINVFGAETTDHITRETVRILLDDCLENHPTPRKAAHAAVAGLVTYIFCDPEHPENFTCYQPEQKEPYALVHTARGWQRRPIEEVLAPMTVRAVDELFRKQPCVNHQKYGQLVSCISENEQEFERGQDARSALGQLKHFLGATLTKLPAPGETRHLAPGATDPPSPRPITRKI